MRMFPPVAGDRLEQRPRTRSREPALEARAIDRLREVVVGTYSQERRGLGLDRDDDHRDRCVRRIDSQIAEDLLAPSIGETQVEDDRERSAASERKGCPCETTDDLGPEVQRRRDGNDEVGIVTLVLDDKDPLTHDGLGPYIRQTDMEGSASAFNALKGDRTAHPLDQSFGQREPE